MFNSEHPKGLCSTVNHLQFYKNGILHTGYSSKVNFDEKLDGNWQTLSSQDNIFYKQFRNEIIKGLFKRCSLQLIDFIVYKFIYKQCLNMLCKIMLNKKVKYHDVDKFFLFQSLSLKLEIFGKMIVDNNFKLNQRYVM